MYAPVRSGHKGRFLRIDGQPIHVREQGAAGSDRSPAVLVHGHFGSARQWSPLMTLLGQAMPCVAVDLPGFGPTHLRCATTPAPQRKSWPASRRQSMAATLIRTVLPTRFSLLRMAGQIEVPTLILWGADDTTLPVCHARELAELMPKAKLAVNR
ncbi:MAG TPA: alpha/beta fold hydrolase [Candidatus Limnocylindrales bacterium]|nr:alpha/beta fold hydrolase [Candidatus Limnocylindrales bacterium]